ncbi:MAG: sigma 54-interacting transcriptional regulator [Candidatus Aminicenantes bacterium]
MSSSLDKILDLIMSEISCQRVMLSLFGEDNRVAFKVWRPHPPPDNGDRSWPIIRKTLERKNPVMKPEIRTVSCVDKNPISLSSHQEKVLCVPFIIPGRGQGILYVERNHGFCPFSHKNLEFLVSFLKPLALVLESCVELPSVSESSLPITGPALVGKSPSFYGLMDLIAKVKDEQAPVFIWGESGTGKELVARAIHQQGVRKKGRFVAVNCGAIPEHLLESELFGYVRGAFTGAVKDRAGLIEEADGGTFFLDEICDLSLHLQAKLLRLLQEKEIRRIGENHTRKVDVRFISATNKNIERENELGRFREDLYYRLKIITVELAPLRERKEDLLCLLNYFLDKYCTEMNRDRAYFSPGALELLLNYEWPGNVRELQSEIQKCLILSKQGCLIKEDHLSSKINPCGERYTPTSYLFLKAKAEFEKRFLNQALLRWNCNKTKTAREIGLSRQGLFKLLKKHKIVVLKGKRNHLQNCDG